MQTKEQRKQDESSRMVVSRISQKAIYQQNNLEVSHLPTSEDELPGGSRGVNLDEKTLLEEAFINFHDLLRRSRLKVLAALQQAESTRTPPIIVKAKIGMSDETYIRLKTDRIAGWRGFVNLSDLHTVLRNFGFFEAVSELTFERFLEKMKCIREKKAGAPPPTTSSSIMDLNWVNYIKLFACVTRYKSSMSHLTKKFFLIDFKSGEKRIRTFRKFDEKPAAEAIATRYALVLAKVRAADEKKRVAALAIEQTKQGRKSVIQKELTEE